MLNTKKQTIAAIKKIRKITGWSQRAIEREAGLGLGVVCRLMNAPTDGYDRVPSIETRTKINNVLVMVSVGASEIVVSRYLAKWVRNDK